MKKYLLLILIMTACGSTPSQPSSESAPALSREQAEILLDVYESMSVLEDLTHPDWNETFARMVKNRQYIWEPLSNRLQELARSSVVKPGDKLYQDASIRAKAQKRYLDLRRSLIKIARQVPDREAVSLVITHLDKDVPEALVFLKEISGESYGYSIISWQRWHLAKVMAAGHIDTSPVISAYHDASDKEQADIVRALLQATSQLLVETKFLEIQNQSDTPSDYEMGQQKDFKGTINSKNFQEARILSLAVFFEAIGSNNNSAAHLAIAGLGQLLDIGEDALINQIGKTSNNVFRHRAIQVLGQSSRLSTAQKLYEWSQTPDLMVPCLLSLGDMTLSKDDKKKLISSMERRIKNSHSSDEKMLLLTALVIWGETHHFRRLLKMCPENAEYKDFIYSKQIQHFGWLQMRRIVKAHFSKLFKRSMARLGSDNQQTAETNINFMRKFKDYCQRYKLNLTHANWLKWSENL